MSKKGTRTLASATLMTLVLTTALSAVPAKAAAGSVTRLGEVDRYATAAKVATSNWTTSDDVILVSGEGYADAVSASALAKKLNAPILLTKAGVLNDDTQTALASLKAKNVYIIGGIGAVSQSIRDGLKANYNLVELGGANRYETNAKVAEKLVELGVSASEVMMVGGQAFSDALSVAPIAAAKGQILLLGTNDANYMSSVLDFVKKNNSKVTVVGTINMISDSILNSVNGTRIDGGVDRFDTNLKVLAAFKDVIKTDKMYVASALGDEGYPDALVASAVAGKTGAPLILTSADGSDATNNAVAYIKTNATKTTDLNVVGGTGVVSEDLVGKINNAVNPTPPNPGSPEVSVGTITATNLNQVKVVFSNEVDEDSAENIANYKIDGTTLATADATANLADDNKTLLITLKQPKEQQKEYTVSVKNSVLSADKTKNVPATDQKVTFADSQAPTVESVAVKGNSKITVKFSEPVKMPVTAIDNGDGTTTYNVSTNLDAKFKINDQNITSFGLDTTRSEVKDAIIIPGAAAPAVSPGAATTVWADEVDFYFTSKLPAGTNTLDVADGDTTANILADAAGFIVKEDKTKTFTVDTVATQPVIKGVTADADGTIWVKYDRPMDAATAIVAGNYGINGDSTALSANGELKEGDCTVKFKGNSSLMNTNSNTLYIKNNVKDAYGNKVADDTRVSFTLAEDKTKPTVTNVSMIDSETIRMTFSKDIDVNYATNASNYTLKDASGVDISSHIRLVKEANKAEGVAYTNDNVWDIKIYKNEGEYQTALGNTPTQQQTSTDWRLTSSKYSLTIKYLVDTTTNKNVMDDYTATINGSDDVAPKMNASAYRKEDHKIVVVFSEAMDTSNLANLDNYKYQNNTGDSKQLPSDTKITIGNDSKTLTFEFPTSYYIDGVGIPAGLGDDNIVKGIIASNLKDLAGNTIDSFNNSATIGAGAVGTFAYKDNTYRMENDGDDLVVKVQFANSIDPDTAVPGNFTVAGQNPDSVSIVGSDVVLRFNKDSKVSPTTTMKAGYEAVAANKAMSINSSTKGATDTIDKISMIKLYGADAQLIVSASVKDMTGATPGVGGLTVSNVFDYMAAPQTTSDYWYATGDSGVTVNGSANAAAVVLTFDTALDASNTSAKLDDFNFNVNGTAIKADQVKVSGNTLVFFFTDASEKALVIPANKVSVTLKSNSTIDVESKEDANKNSAKYVPSNDDKTKTRDVNVSATVDLTSMSNM